MASLNQINLIGRVGHTPEIRIGGQTTICNFTLAVDEFTKTDSGWATQTEWFRCTGYNKTADTVKDRVKKGSQIYVSGKMRSRKYTGKDGIERTVWEVVVNHVVKLNKSEDEQTTETQTQTQTPPETKPDEKQAAQPAPKPKQMKLEEPKEPIKFPEPEDDELPF